MPRYNKFFIPILIVLLSFFLRFYHLGLNPPSLNWDETAHGYNAFSILKTAKDEYGYKLPLFFRSFDDYKPPLYTYLVVPSVAIFGLSDYAVRFPSAALGTLAVFFTYLLVFELFKIRKVALLAAFFLALSPWHLQFSRVAFETNSATFWSVLGTWAFLRGLRSDGKFVMSWFVLTSLSFGANLYMYHNARVFIPMLTVVLFSTFKDKLLSVKKYMVIPMVIALIFVAFLVPIVTSISGQLRFKGTSVFGDESPLYKASEQIHDDESQGQLIQGKLLHNRRLVYVPIILQNYFSHWSPTFLFFTADMDRHHAPLIGLLYLWDLPFVICGIYFLARKSLPNKSKIIIFTWFLLAPVASSVTWGVPHSLRSAIFLPTFQIFTALGVYYLITPNKYRKIALFVYMMFFVANFSFYLHQYHVHMPKQFSRAWLYGRKEAALFTEKQKNNYNKVIVSTALEQPHEFWLYYLKYDPQTYLHEGGTVSGGFLEDRNEFDKYQFKPINFQEQSREEQTLFVGLPSEFPNSANVVKKINYLDGEEAIYIVEGQSEI